MVDAKRLKLYASFFLISLDKAASQLLKSMRLLEKEFDRPQTNGLEIKRKRKKLKLKGNLHSY